MERKYKLTIPEPCTESWDKMTPKDNGRYCMSCSKTVIDFTSMLPNEVQHFFIQNQNQNICGRFKNSQLETITIQIPNRILYTQTHYHKIFLLALFIAMGTTLFSCQDKDGNKNKIDKVEVIQNDAPVEHISVGEPKITNSHDTIVPPPPPPPKVDQVKFVKPKENDNRKTEIINNKKNSSTKVAIYATPNGEVVSETNAEFPGGIEQFYNFFEKEFKEPKDINTANLKIKLSFAVERNGSVSFLQSEPSVDKTLETEIIRVLSLSPKWQPATSNGKKIRMQYSLPIVLE
ncbi:hypothetical protein D3C85_924500 [compost metagenome]|jgi:hypothetical protein